MSRFLHREVVEQAGEDSPVGVRQRDLAGLAWTYGAQPALVLALGRGRERHLGPDQPLRAAVDPPRATGVETLGRHGH
uniref:hypothetical protein n=1 Tax=Streptomyces acidicola TaxID=2596892 RepID=UPI001883F148|nr:hypothetical protein [Streptomyces acidicola]